MPYRQKASKGNQYRLILPYEIHPFRPKNSAWLSSVSPARTTDSSTPRATQTPAVF